MEISPSLIQPIESVNVKYELYLEEQKEKKNKVRESLHLTILNDEIADTKNK